MPRPDRRPAPPPEPTAHDRAVEAIHKCFDTARQQRGISKTEAADLLDKISAAIFATDAAPTGAIVPSSAEDPGDHNG